jgi:SNF2 family DNA or RNA helicase
MLSRTNMHKYQTDDAQFIVDKKRCALWLDMGLGKTVTTLTAIVDLIDSFAINRALVIAPLRVANSVWHNEASEWSHLNHLSFAICTGPQNNRIDALNIKADVTVVNRENVEWLVNHYGKKWPFDCVVIDESDSFKNPSSKRFKALRKVANLSEYFVELTGTPSPNGLLDLWSQVYLLDTGARLGRSMTAYKSKHFTADYMGFSFTPKADAKTDIENALKDIVSVRTATDHIDLPERIDIVSKVQLNAPVMKQYKQLEKEFLLTIEQSDIEALSAAALANKCLQFCNGAVYDENKNVIDVHGVKIDALADMLESHQNENVLIAYNFKSDLARLKARFPDAVELDKNPKTIERWNGGEIKMLLAHPASAGHGLNIQKGGALCIWFGLNWSLGLYQQFNARLHRQGQKQTVRIVHLVVDGCIDEKVMLAIKNKAKTQSDLIAALKKI